MRHGSSESGFTTVELMVVVLIIGILLSIALLGVASIRTSAERNSCFSNEHNIEAQYANWRTETNGSLPAPGDWTELMDVLVPDYIAEQPVCPAATGTYSWSTTESVSCSVHGHY